MAAPFVMLVKGTRKCWKSVTVFKALLENITKVLRFKIIKTPAEI